LGGGGGGVRTGGGGGGGNIKGGGKKGGIVNRFSNLPAMLDNLLPGEQALFYMHLVHRIYQGDLHR
jgi:hypothetical protein